MHNIDPVPEKDPQIYLYSRSLTCRTFYSYEDLYYSLDLKWIREWVGKDYNSPIKIVTKRASGLFYDSQSKRFRPATPEEYFYVEADFILRTSFGEKITAEDLEPIYRRIKMSRSRKPKWLYRQGRKTNYCYGRYRNPHTTNEKRKSFPIQEEGEPKIRAKRNYNNLPTSWDDKITHPHKSWKYQSKRKRQYKEK